MTPNDGKLAAMKKAKERLSLFYEVANIRAGQPPRKSQRRFRLAVGYLCLALFSMTVALFPWPGFTLVDKVMWVVFALVLLLIGGWQLDKSNREPDGDRGGAPSPTTPEPSTESNVHFLHRKH